MRILPEALLARIMKLENLVFGNNGHGWTTFTPTSPFVTQPGSICRYRMRNDGAAVEISGIVQSNPTPGTTILSSGTLLTLPTGFRPSFSQGFGLATFPGGAGFAQSGNTGVVNIGSFTGSPTAAVISGFLPLG